MLNYLKLVMAVLITILERDREKGRPNLIMLIKYGHGEGWTADGRYEKKEKDGPSEKLCLRSVRLPCFLFARF